MEPLVQKIRASGRLKVQSHKPKKPKVYPSTKHSLTSATTIKGSSRAHIARDGMPVSIEPIKAPRSITLSSISRKLKVPK